MILCISLYYRKISCRLETNWHCIYKVKVKFIVRPIRVGHELVNPPSMDGPQGVVVVAVVLHSPAERDEG